MRRSFVGRSPNLSRLEKPVVTANFRNVVHHPRWFSRGRIRNSLCLPRTPTLAGPSGPAPVSYETEIQVRP